MVQDLRGGRVSSTAKVPAASKPADIRRLESDISAELGALVTIDHSAKGSGKIVIRYASLDELDGVLGHIRKGR